MFDSVTAPFDLFLRTAILAAVVLTPSSHGTAVDRPAEPQKGGRSWVERRGEHGGDLPLLRTSYTPPSSSGESNHYFDLWEPGAVASFARIQGLTNNRALFIDSHGTERFSWKGAKHVFRPGAAVAGEGEVHSYSIRDIFEVVGVDVASQIHNVIVAGCNLGGRVRSAEVRLYFPHATNVTYMSPGKLAYKPVFYQSLTEHSEDIRPLYGRVVEDGQAVKATISREPLAGAKPLGNYVADLFTPASSKPYRTQIAGRELLDPSCQFSKSLRAASPSPTAAR